MKERPPNMRRLNREHALSEAKRDTTEWINIQIWTLEDYLMKMAGEKLCFDRKKEKLFIQKLKGLEYTVKNLTALGKEYYMLAGYDLETESLNTFCRRNNIRIIIPK